jgi:cupin fold WbuC family metalloprotein
VQNREVLYSNKDIATVSKMELDYLKQLAASNPRKRVRLCSHLSEKDLLHEMIFVQEIGAYVRHHKHLTKCESIHIIEGLVDLVIFNEDGNIDDVIRMGDYSSGKIFFFRMSNPLFHTLIVRSQVLVFHETTNGPFNLGEATFAPWAPDGKVEAQVNSYLTSLDKKIKLLELVK